MRKIISKIIGVGLWAHLGTAQAGVLESVEQYLENGRAVLNQLAREHPDAAKIEVDISVMIELTKPVLEAYAGLKPQCQQQLEKVLELLPEIDTWEPQEIRRQIEAAQGLPPAQGCYAARDIVAHPAIVRAIVRRGGSGPTQQMRLAREMDEAMEHMEEIRTLLQ